MLISLFVYRDRVPFVLTSDMVYVINNGEKQSDKFQLFVDLCCQAFNILRKNANLFLNLFALVRSPFEIILIDNVDLSNIFKFLQDNFYFLSWYMYIMTHCIHIMYIYMYLIWWRLLKMHCIELQCNHWIKWFFFSILIWTKTILHELFACTIISKKSCDFLLGFYHEINSEMLI